MFEGLAMTWWQWMVLGIVLLGLEALTPGGLVLVFFGAGAIAVGILSAVGLAGTLWVQVILFVVLSSAALLTLRRTLLSRLRRGDPGAKVDKLVGEVARVLEDIAVDGMGKVEMRGTIWNARNVGDLPLAIDQRSRVVRVEGLTLWVCGE